MRNRAQRSKVKRSEPALLVDWKSAELVSLGALLPRLICDNAGDIKPEVLFRGIVVREYALIDLSLTALLYLYYFGITQKELAVTVESGRFLSFYKLAENVPLVRKLKLLRAVLDVPTKECKRIQRINEVRNAIAHVAFAEVSSRGEFRYGKERLFSEVGIRRLMYDIRRTHDYLGDVSSKLYKGSIKFKHSGHQLSTYDLYSALIPSMWSCARLAEELER